MGLPVERKVTASTAAAAFSGLLLWAAGRYIFKGSVPDVVVSWVYVIIPSVITFMAGYAAKHTPRPVTLHRAPKTLQPRGGYSAGNTVVADLPPPPPSVTQPPPEGPP